MSRRSPVDCRLIGGAHRRCPPRRAPARRPGWSPCPSTDWPSTSTNSSPASMPAPCAGPSLMTDTTTTISSRWPATHADADHVAAQRVLLAGHLLGRKEDRVAGVAQRLDQAPNGAVGQLSLVQLAAADEVIADGLEGLPEEAEVGPRVRWLTRPGDVARLSRCAPVAADSSANSDRRRTRRRVVRSGRRPRRR